MGSEMCIRDRAKEAAAKEIEDAKREAKLEEMEASAAENNVEVEEIT